MFLQGVALGVLLGYFIFRIAGQEEVKTEEFQELIDSAKDAACIIDSAGYRHLNKKEKRNLSNRLVNAINYFEKK